MKILSFVEDKLVDLKNKMDKKEDELKKLKDTTIEQLWETDLDNFERIYKETLSPLDLKSQ